MKSERVSFIFCLLERNLLRMDDDTPLIILFELQDCVYLLGVWMVRLPMGMMVESLGWEMHDILHVMET